MNRPRKSSQRLVAVQSTQDAALYDTHVVPRYSALFGRLLLSALPQRERLQVLDVGCGSGYPALEVLRRLGDGGRVIAIDPDPALLDVARRRALDETGRRIFFKVESAEQLSFRDDVFDVVIGNLALGSFEQPEGALREMRRVLVPAGRLLLTHPLAGTFEEVLDMFREVALKTDSGSLAQRIERVAARYPSASTLQAVVAGAGFEDVDVQIEEFQVPFGSAAELFRDAMVRFVALPEWQWIAGSGGASADPFAAFDGHEGALEQVQRALEIYFGGGPLSLRVSAGLVTARR